MYKNELDNEKLDYCITIDGEDIPVTEAVYRAYKQPLWRERKRQERQRAKSMDGSDCTRAEGAAPLSIEKMLEDGFDIPMRGPSPEDIYIWKETVEALHEALAQLTQDERDLLELVGSGLSDRKIAAKTEVPQTTISYRRRILMKRLCEQMKDFR